MAERPKAAGDDAVLRALASRPAPPPGAILVLACGNDLRGDDAVGARFIAAIEETKRHLPSPWQEAIATHWQLQWGPETATLFAGRRAIYLVDAFQALPCACEERSASPSPYHLSAEPLSLVTRPLTPDNAAPEALLASVGSHRVTPEALLAAAQLLAIPLPATLWLIAIPAYRFTFAAPLSPDAERALDAALRWFWREIAEHWGE
ncbi:hypothetical protein JCM16106_19720 [Hydrogenophilus islandicus]